MVLKIDWSTPVIPKDIIMQIQPPDLEDFYLKADSYDKSNLFFVFLTSFYHYSDVKNIKEAAHLSFLMAYYLFMTLTPPGSMTLALHYIKQAISLNPLEEYKEWLHLIEKGN
ncbi:hypothetical protein ACOMD2_14585 [Hominicoprocola fusiformis]